MKKQKIFYVIVVLVVLILIVIGVLYNKDNNSKEKINNGKITTEKTGQYDEFATCIKDSGAVFYGAWWCPHCEANKKAFGDSADKLPYVECATEDGKGQTEVCKKEEIKAYPTWRFADGSEAMGEQSFESLAEKTGCTLPSTK